MFFKFLLKNLLAILFTIIFSKVFSQDVEYYKTLYEKGKNLLISKHYDLAAEIFQVLIQEKKNNPYTPHAYFLLALSYFNQKKYQEAKEKWLYLQQKFTSFKEDEVSYMLGNTYFELKEYDKALKQVALIKNPELKKKTIIMKTFYIGKFKEPKFLKPLLDRNPQDTIVALQLYKICRDSESIEWKNFSKQIQLRFSVEDLNLLNLNPSIANDTLRISLLFPFTLLEQKQKLGEYEFKFLADFIAGILFASDSLNKIGLYNRLYPIDIDKDTSKFLEYINSDLFHNVTFSIGPIFNNLNDYVHQISEKTNHTFIVPFANPTPSKSNVVFLQTPYAIIAENTVEAALKEGKNNFIIFYSGTTKDSIYAISCKKKIESLKANLIEFRKVEKANAATVFSKILTKNQLENTDAIFIFSNDQMVATQYITALSLSTVPKTTYVSDEWLNYESLNYKQLQSLGFRFITGLNYIHLHEDYQKLNDLFKAKYGIYPSEYPILGFEAMMFFSYLAYHKKIATSKAIADEELKTNYYSSKLFRYSNTTHNLYSSIYFFRDNELRMINSQPDER